MKRWPCAMASFVELPHKQSEYKSRSPQGDEPVAYSLGRSLCAGSYPSSGLIVVSIWIEHLLARDLMQVKRTPSVDDVR